MSESDITNGSETPPDDASSAPASKRVDDVLAPDERMATKDRVTLVIAALGLAIGLINSVIVASNYFTTAGTSERTTQLEAERDLDAAWDLLAGTSFGPAVVKVPESAPMRLPRTATVEQREKARRLLRDVLIRDPSNVRARNLMAWYFEASSDWQSAIDVRRALLKELPSDPQRVAALASSLLSTQRWDEAIALIEGAVATKPDRTLYQLLSSALYGKNRTRGLPYEERRRLEQRIKEVGEAMNSFSGDSATSFGGDFTVGGGRWSISEWRVVKSGSRTSIVGSAFNATDKDLDVTVYFLLYDASNTYLGEFNEPIGPIPSKSPIAFEMDVPAATAKAWLSGAGG
jgi:tetratricopeptide (TPR) repeat protein